MVFNGKLCPPDRRVSMKSLVSLELEKSGDAFPLDEGGAPVTCGHCGEHHGIPESQGQVSSLCGSRCILSTFPVAGTKELLSELREIHGQHSS